VRIVQLTTNIARGGAETQVVQLSMRLRARGWDVSVVSLVQPSAFTIELQRAGVPLYAPGVAGVPALLRRLRPQLLHCHMFHANITGRLLRTVMPFQAVISTLHSAAESSRKSGAIRGRDWLYRITDPLASVSVAVSQAVAERHVAARAVRNPRVIPNGIDTEVFRPDIRLREQTRAELELPDGEFTWLAAGRLMWKKNFPALLEAFRALDHGTLLIAGSGPDEERLRAAAGPRVRFLGRRDDMPAVMTAADGFVLSSIVEGLPLVLLEAAACGLPCVATDAGGVRETGVAEVVAAGELGDAMRRVMSGQASAHGRERVLAEYSLDRTVERWEALYRELAGWT
jgi:glycosyltransferase involved in cell wall biosynthesis